MAQKLSLFRCLLEYDQKQDSTEAIRTKKDLVPINIKARVLENLEKLFILIELNIKKYRFKASKST